MTEYRVTWCQKPHNYNTPRVLFIEAANAEDAQVIARNYIERKHGIAATEFTIQNAREAPAVPAGSVRKGV